jgi:hypothetical protein
MSKSYKIPLLPLASDVETKPILKLAASAHRYLAELKGIAKRLAHHLKINPQVKPSIHHHNIMMIFTKRCKI